MISRGLVDEGLRVVESARLRHDGERRNPWNEPECGHHYARALSGWGPLLALSGFLYNKPAGRLDAKPRINAEAFTSFWSAGAGWGVFSHSVKEGRLHFTLAVKAGRLACRSVALGALVKAEGESSAAVGKTNVAHQARRTGEEIVVTFAEELDLKEGDKLSLVV